MRARRLIACVVALAAGCASEPAADWQPLDPSEGNAFDIGDMEIHEPPPPPTPVVPPPVESAPADAPGRDLVERGAQDPVFRRVPVLAARFGPTPDVWPRRYGRTVTLSRQWLAAPFSWLDHAAAYDPPRSARVARTERLPGTETVRDVGVMRMRGETRTARLVVWPDPDDFGTQVLELRRPGEARVVASYSDDAYAQGGGGLWDWRHPPWDQQNEDPLHFPDLNRDGYDDFGLVTDAYRFPQVSVWLSDARGRHHRAVDLQMPVVVGDEISEIAPMRWNEDWTVRAYDLSKSTEPLYTRRYGVVPGVSGPPRVYVYEDPDRLREARRDKRLPPPPDRIVPVAEVPGLDRAPESLAEFEAWARETALQRAVSVWRTRPRFSLAASDPWAPTSPTRDLTTYPELAGLGTPRERAETYVTLLYGD